MSSWSQGFLSFDPFQTLASSGISVFRSRRREKSGSRKVRALSAGSSWAWVGRQQAHPGWFPAPQATSTPPPGQARVGVAPPASVSQRGSGGAPPRGQRGQQGFMGKDLSATGEDILPAFPSSCGRSPRPRFSSTGGPPLRQLGCPITPPVLPPGSRALTPGSPGQPPGMAALHGELSICQPAPPPRSPSGGLRQPVLPLRPP